MNWFVALVVSLFADFGFVLASLATRRFVDVLSIVFMAALPFTS